MSGFDPVERDYLVVVEHELVYRVRAESPEDAAVIVDQGDDLGQPEEFLGAHIERVVEADGNWSDPDLRRPRTCEGGCGKTLAANQPAECTDCFLDRLRRKREAQAAAGVQ